MQTGNKQTSCKVLISQAIEKKVQEEGNWKAETRGKGEWKENGKLASWFLGTEASVYSISFQFQTINPDTKAEIPTTYFKRVRFVKTFFPKRVRL
jgi:hypothetical protein